MEVQLREVDPNVERVVEGLRDTGYSFTAAIADLVDNSIAASASFVNVVAEFAADTGRVIVRVCDDGSGMDLAGLENAMRYGSDEREDPHSLGRFGLGLKTASTSFCRRLTVVSRASSEGAEVVAAAWDLDLIAERGKWLLSIGGASAQESDEFAECMQDLANLGSETTHGTVVMWDNVDRLLVKKQGGAYQHPDRELKKRLDKLTFELGMIFQRFIDASDTRARNVTIAVNGDVVKPWDPFGERFGIDPIQEPTIWELEDPTEEVQGQIALRAFILPHETEVSDPDYRDAIKFSNDRQGFFVYRENRLIERGWLDFVVNEPHWNRLRIEMSFPAPLDDFFGVGIKKSGLHLDAGLEMMLRDFSDPLRREASQTHRSGAAKRRSTNVNPATRPTEIAISRTEGLTRPKVTAGDDGSVTVRNTWQEDLPVILPGGSPNPAFRVLHSEDGPSLAVVPRETLEDGVLWQPTINRGGSGSAVSINVSHDWYRKAYLPYASDNTLAQAIDFLLFALSEAELNNTSPAMSPRFEEFRIEVSRNLRRLVADLDEYVDEND